MYPPQALHARVEGKVVVKVSIGGDGTVKQAEAISGPEGCARQPWTTCGNGSSKPREQEAQIDVAFSLAGVTRSLALPEPVRRTAPVYREH